MAERKHAPVHSGVIGTQNSDTKIKFVTPITLEGVPSIKLGYVFSIKDDFGKPTKFDVIKEYVDDGNLDLPNIKKFFEIHKKRLDAVCRKADLSKFDYSIDFVVTPSMQASNNAVKVTENNIVGLMQKHVAESYDALNQTVIYPIIVENNRKPKENTKEAQKAVFTPEHNDILRKNLEK